MLKWAKELFPLCRSITGNGTRETLNYFKTINKEFKILKFKTGKKVFDWVIPQEWNIKDAYIEHESKKRFAEFKKCNLHIVHYSEPINKKISKKEAYYVLRENSLQCFWASKPLQEIFGAARQTWEIISRKRNYIICTHA